MDKKEFEQPEMLEIENTEVVPVQQPQEKKKKETIDSIEELNQLAAELKEAGDKKNLFKLAEQYGIDKEDVEDYLDGVVEEFATLLMTAVGKLKHESAVLGLKGLVKDWAECVEQMCTEDEELCRAVMKSDRKLVDCMGSALRYAFENKVKLNDDVVKAAKLDPPIYLGVPGKAELKKLITDYYMK